MKGTRFHIILPLILLALTFSLGAQDGHSLITLQANEIPLRRILDQIEEQSGLSFSYGSRLIDEKEPVTLQVVDQPLGMVLDELFGNRKVSFKVVERQIVLKRAKRLKVEVEAGLVTEGDSHGPVQFTVSGYVKDARTGEVLIGATITIPGGREGTITNDYGFYSLTLKEAVDRLNCSYVGYGHHSILVDSMGNQVVHFTMEKEVAHLSEVTIISSDDINIIRTSRSSEVKISPESVRKMPALFGEKDVIKSLAAIPGIKFFGDGSTIFYVRGGARDQNMITIDEAPVYNPAHLLGFFSTIIPDAVKDVKIYKGDFPANYGGRLSSLIDIHTKDGNMNQF